MSEYIEQEAAVETLNALKPFLQSAAQERLMRRIIRQIGTIPAADVAPVRHGRWHPVLDGVWNLPMPVLAGWRCSECGRTEQEKEPYCNCGAKMDLEGGNA